MIELHFTILKWNVIRVSLLVTIGLIMATAQGNVFAEYLPEPVMSSILEVGVKPTQIDISKCYGPFHCQSYLEVAQQLQALNETQRADQLRSWAADESVGLPAVDGEAVIILCRMLFEPQPGKILRSPALGSRYLLGSNYIDIRKTLAWPLEPITLVDGIPFKVARGYTDLIAGGGEPSSDYLEYCLKEAQWTSRHYAAATADATKQALSKLLKQQSWERELNADEVKYLSDQIMPFTPPAIWINSTAFYGLGIDFSSHDTGYFFDAPNADQPRMVTLAPTVVMDKIEFQVGGGQHPYHYSLTLLGEVASKDKIIYQGPGPGTDIWRYSYSGQKIKSRWPAPVVGDRYMFTLIDAQGSTISQLIEVKSLNDILIYPPKIIMAQGKPLQNDIMSNTKGN